MTPFAEHLAELRTARNWTQKELAKRTGLSTSVMNRIQKGHREPTLSELYLLADALHVSLPVLLDAKEETGEPLLTEVPAVYRDRFAMYLERRVKEVRGLSA